MNYVRLVPLLIINIVSHMKSFTCENGTTVIYNDWYSKDVTSTFDHSRIYCRILRPEEKKYKIGLNDENDKNHFCVWTKQCKELYGGFYFTSIEDSLSFFDWGSKVSFVFVPKNAKVYKQNPEYFDNNEVWRADKVVLTEPLQLNVTMVMFIIYNGATVSNFIINKILRSLPRSLIENGEQIKLKDAILELYDRNKNVKDKTPNSKLEFVKEHKDTHLNTQGYL